MASTENSVTTALSELRELESRRLLDERRAEEKRQREERERIESQARQDVMQRVEQDRSLEVLRAELAAARAAREAMHLELKARVARAPSAPPKEPWILAFGIASISAASLAGLLVFQERAVIQHAEPEPSHAIETARPTPAFGPPIEAVRPVTIEDPPAVAASPEPTREPRRVRRPSRLRDRRPEPERDLARDLALDEEGDDVLSDRFLRDATLRQ